MLTSADFGDAYLRDGWASQYIEDRMRLGILVLVGYRAEDAALRLLLETLDADRDRFHDLKDIYAIEKSSIGSASQWKAKGIKPIEFSNYDAIYATLSEWGQIRRRSDRLWDGARSGNSYWRGGRPNVVTDEAQPQTTKEENTQGRLRVRARATAFLFGGRQSGGYACERQSLPGLASRPVSNRI